MTITRVTMDTKTTHRGHHGYADTMTPHTAIPQFLPVLEWVKDTYILFEAWTTSSVLELTLGMVAAAFLAAAYDLLRYYLSSWDNSQATLPCTNKWRRVGLRLYRSFMHSLVAGLVYLQMLFAMTYDLRIFVAVILGSGIGFFLLGPFFRRLHEKRKRQVVKELTVEYKPSCGRSRRRRAEDERDEGGLQQAEELLGGIEDKVDDEEEEVAEARHVVVLDEDALQELSEARNTVV